MEATTTTGGETEGTTSFPLISHITPFNYLVFLALSLLVFLGHLILPKGLRAQYCGAGRRRYRRQRRSGVNRGRRGKLPLHSPATRATGLSSTLSPAEDILGNIYAYSHSFSPQDQVVDLFNNTPSTTQVRTMPLSPQTTQSSYLKSEINSRAESGVWSGVDDHDVRSGSQSLASNNIIGSSRNRNNQQRQQQQHDQPLLPQELKEILKHPPGVKFVAHGTKCKPRSVWITLHIDDTESTRTAQSAGSKPPIEYHNCLTWRAELKTSSSPTNKPPKLGNLRKVLLSEVLGIELGKRTTALRRVQTAKGVHQLDCFSLLTKTGTLDLECTPGFGGGDGVRSLSSSASAEEVRAAFITCLAMSMSSKGLRLNGLRQQPLGSTPVSNAPSSLQSQLQGLHAGSSPTSPPNRQWDEGSMSIYSGLLSEARTISTVSF